MPGRGGASKTAREIETGDPLRQSLARCRPFLFGIAVISMAVNLLMLTTSIYMMQLFDRVLTSGSRETLFFLTVVATGAVVLLAVLETVRGQSLARIASWLEQALAPATLPRMVDDVLERKADRVDALLDLSILRSFLGGSAILTLFDAPWVPLYLAVVYLLHPVLGHVALAGATALFVLALLNDRVTRDSLKTSTLLARRAGRGVESALRNAEAIDAMGLSDHVARRWSTDGTKALQLLARSGTRSALVVGASKFVRLFVQIVVLAVGAALALNQELSAGAMIAAAIVMGRALAPLELGIGSWKQAVQALEAKRRLERFFRQPPRREQAIPLPEPKGRLAVESVVYGFAASRPPILHGVSFCLEPGEALGIIGPSAAGKSTLARLLVGVERPAAGIVRLDGADVFGWLRSDLGRHVGYLPQDVELFSGTVAENIARLGKPDPAAVVQAATLANCHDMILSLDSGYSTDLGDRALNLSGGQRQLVALARALYGCPRFVVLDEPNANLDAEGDAALNRTIAELKAAGTTVVVIGHRLSTFASVDKLVVLVGGAVQHFGARGEVLEKITRRRFHSIPPIVLPTRPSAGLPGQTKSQAARES
ncbi:MAG: type I secretion system permease/ATPase [Bacteroidota bacterium]